MTTVFQNDILQRCEPDVISRLALRPVDLPVRREVEFPGRRIENLIFIEVGIASMTTTFRDGFEVEVAICGREAVLGASALLGTQRSLNRVYMQVAGSGYISDTSTARREFRRGGLFHDLVLASQQAQFVQTAQTAACNSRHTVEQRFARWLLLCADRMHNETLLLKHEFVADMLGVTRSSISISAGSFQERGLIQYSRGRVQILDRPRLEGIACECYQVVREHLANYIDIADATSASSYSKS